MTMSFPLLLAHGMLGPFDEMIFGGVTLFLLVMVAVSWIRSGSDLPVPPEETSDLSASDESPQPPDHFPLH